MMTDYILSPCSLAARGLSQLMVNAAKRPVELPVEGVSLRELTAVRIRTKRAIPAELSLTGAYRFTPYSTC